MRIVWSIGDLHGIGPEIILKSFLKLQQSDHSFLVAGSFSAMEYYKRVLDLPVTLKRIDHITEVNAFDTNNCRGILTVLNVAEPETINPGTISANAGSIAMQSLSTAAELCRKGICDAVVTAPIHKEAVSLAGYAETGHTDFLGKMFAVPSPIMMFFDPVLKLRIALATIHVPLKDVPELIRQMNLENFLTALCKALTTDFQITTPRIAVLGLNPHASDNGVIGNEEKDIILPCIKKLSTHICIEGPFPADGFFGAKTYRNYDIVVAMYHDQGLLPFKVLAFDTGVNITLGLPIVRTSPDHGTSFDIAGKGIASEKSFYEATQLAIRIANNRKQTTPS
ncbi:MAG: 4-hydroxythreonine-4-phosphate dehydrogenase PdxA [Chlorobiaceae bacterium]